MIKKANVKNNSKYNKREWGVLVAQSVNAFEETRNKKTKQTLFN